MVLADGEVTVSAGGTVSVRMVTLNVWVVAVRPGYASSAPATRVIGAPPGVAMGTATVNVESVTTAVFGVFVCVAGVPLLMVLVRVSLVTLRSSVAEIVATRLLPG